MYTVVDKICSFIFENKLSEKFKNLYWIMHCPPVLTFGKNIFVISKSSFHPKCYAPTCRSPARMFNIQQISTDKTPLKVGAVICSSFCTTKHKQSMKSLRFTHTNANFSTF